MGNPRTTVLISAGVLLAAGCLLASGCMQLGGAAKPPWNVTDPPHRSPYARSLRSPQPAAPRAAARVPEPAIAQRPTVPPDPDPSQSPVPPRLRVDAGARGTGGPMLPPPDSEGARLALTVEAPPRRQVGSEVAFRVTVENAGPEDVPGVAIVVEFEDGLVFSAGRERSVRQPLGRLGAGQKRELTLSLFGERTGNFCATFRAAGGGVEAAAETACVEILPRQADIAIVGPPGRSVGGRAELTFKVSNTSPGPLKEVAATVSYEGSLTPREGSAGAVTGPQSLRWILGDLQPGEGAQLQVEFECRAESESACVWLDVTAGGIPVERLDRCLRITPADRSVGLSVTDSVDPVRVGEETTFDVVIRNRDLQPMNDVNVTAEMPVNLRPLSAELIHGGETRRVEVAPGGAEIVFPAVESVAPDAAVICRIRAEAVRAGDGAFRARVRRHGAEAVDEIVEATTVNP